MSTALLRQAAQMAIGPDAGVTNVTMAYDVVTHAQNFTVHIVTNAGEEHALAVPVRPTEDAYIAITEAVAGFAAQTGAQTNG